MQEPSLTSEIKLSLIAARAKTGAIGQNGDLPWRLADDLSFFKTTTLGCPIVMGRKTWDSLPKRPLPKRDNIVLTRDWTFEAAGALVLSDLPVAIATAKALAANKGKSEVFVIGGEALYAATIDIADRIYLTEVAADISGDAYFPAFDTGRFAQRTLQTFQAGQSNDFAFDIKVYDRL